MADVLLVDDDEDIQMVLGRYLSQDGHRVTPARTGAEALSSIAAGAEVVLLDLTLPDLDGLEVLRRLRAQGSDVPVLVLTARGEEADRLLGLGFGADDYVVKPLSPREICLRVAALLRRRVAPPVAKAETAEVLRWGEVELVPAEHRVTVRGEEVSLTPREFDLLALLLREPERLHTRSALLDALWPEGYVTDHALDVHLASIRKKLGSALGIANVRGVGYRLMGGDRA